MHGSLQLLTYTDKEFNRYWKQYTPKTVKQAVTVPSPALSQITKVSGRIHAQAAMARMMLFIRENVTCDTAIPERMNKQLQEQADMLYSDFYYLSIAELKFFAREYIKGTYGKDYNRLDVSTLASALNKYCNDRHGIKRTRAKKVEQTGLGFKELPTEVQQSLIETCNKFSADQPIKPNPNDPKEIAVQQEYLSQQEQIKKHNYDQ